MLEGEKRQQGGDFNQQAWNAKLQFERATNKEGKKYFALGMVSN